MSHVSPLSSPWQEAQRRGETYLRLCRGEFGADERHLLASALASARAQSRLSDGTHPVTLVMEALFGFLPTDAPLAMTPPIRRSTMLPEPTEFPVHDWMRRIFRRG